MAATDASGSLTYQAAYEAFGKHGDTPSSQEWGDTPDRQQANTKDEDPTGLLNEGFRYRDLETGSFITRDPLGFVDGPNVYTYVVQNPWTKFDPLGLREDFGDGLTGHTNSDGNFVVLTGGTELVNHVEVGVFNAVSTGNNNFLPQVGDAQENRNAANFAAGMVFDPQARETFEMIATGAAIAADGGNRNTPSRAGSNTNSSSKTNPGVAAQSSPTQSAKVHGNSDKSTNPNHVYVIKGTDGKLKKPGISGQRMNQNQTSPRANPQVNKHNKKNPNDTVDSHVVKQNTSRSGAKSMEQKITDKHAARNKGAMPSSMHKRPTPKVKSREEYIEKYGVPENRYK